MRQQLTANFYADELWCKHCHKIQFHPGYLEKLQAVRTDLGLPMHPTSGCRCAFWNKEIKGHPTSLHIFNVPQHLGQEGTLATDFACVDGKYRGQLFKVAWSHGLSIGWNAKRGFIHLDWRTVLGMLQTSFDYE